MTAIILAAGMGTRLGGITKSIPKCMIKINGVSIIHRLLNHLDYYGFKKATIVIGYKGSTIQKYIGKTYKNIEIEYVQNPIYDKTNNIYSLYLAKEYLLTDDVFLFKSDLILEKSAFDVLFNNRSSNIMLVAKYKELISGMDKLSNFQYLGKLEQSEINKVLLKVHVLINTSVR